MDKPLFEEEDTMARPEDQALLDAIQRRAAAQRALNADAMSPDLAELPNPGNLPDAPIVDSMDPQEQATVDGLEAPVDIVSPSVTARAAASKPIPSRIKAVYGDELSDDAIKGALASKRQIDNSALLSMATNQILAGNAARSGAKVDSDSPVLSELLKRSGVGLEEIKARRTGINEENKAKSDVQDLEKGQLAIDDAKSLADPNSDISRLYRDVATKRLKITVPDNVSASTMMKMVPLLKDTVKKFQQGFVAADGTKMTYDPDTGKYISSGIKVADQAFTTTDPRTGEKLIMGRRLDSEGKPTILGGKGTEQAEGQPFTRDNLNPVQIKAIETTRKDLLKDPTIKAVREALADTSKAETMIQKNIPGSAGAIRRSLLKMFESGGRYTDQDVKQFGGRQDAISNVIRWTNEQATGKGLTKEDQANLLDMMEVLQRTNKEAANSAASFYVDSLVKRGLPEDFARSQATDFMLPGVAPAASEKRVKVKDKNGNSGSIPESQLAAAKKAGYTIIE